MSHPCDGHACDHCYLCDVVGVCCATVPQAASAAVGGAHHAFHARVIAEADGHLGLGQLIRLDSAAVLNASSSRLALPAGQSLARDQLLLSTTPYQEAEHVLAPRRHP